MLNYQQDLILSNLLKSQGLKYSDLKPDSIDKDSYNYHLKFLRDKSYVQKKDNLYVLTNIGKKYVQKLDFNGKSKEYFKASVIAILSREFEGNQQILVQKRLRHPYFGDYMYGISGKMLPGEQIKNAAKRKLKEETGLDAEFEFVGVIRKIRYDKNNRLIEDTIYHICLADAYSGELMDNTEAGEHIWMNLDDFKNIIQNNVTLGSTDHQIIGKLFNEKDFSSFYWVEETTLKDF